MSENEMVHAKISDSELVHYLHSEICEHGDVRIFSCVELEKPCGQGQHALTLCKQHVVRGIVVKDEVNCMDCIMGVDDGDPSLKEERETEKEKELVAAGGGRTYTYKRERTGGT